MRVKAENMKEEFQEFTNQIVQGQKDILDQTNQTGSLDSVMERMKVFDSGLKALNQKLTAQINNLLDKIENVVDEEDTKNALTTIATNGINDYIKYFKAD